MEFNASFIMPMIKPLAKKITEALDRISEEREAQVKFMVQNQYTVVGERIPKEVYETMTDEEKRDTTFVEKVPYKATFLNYKQYMALDEEEKKTAKAGTIILFLEEKEGKNVPFKTIDFLNLLNNI